MYLKLLENMIQIRFQKRNYVILKKLHVLPWSCGGQLQLMFMCCSYRIGIARFCRLQRLRIRDGLLSIREDCNGFNKFTTQTKRNSKQKSLENAARIVACSGGSTNAALHLPALANEIGIDFDILDVAKIFKETPYIADLKPGGKFLAKDLHDIGVPILMKVLLDGGFLDGSCITVTGKQLLKT